MIQVIILQISDDCMMEKCLCLSRKKMIFENLCFSKVRYCLFVGVNSRIKVFEMKPSPKGQMILSVSAQTSSL